MIMSTSGPDSTNLHMFRECVSGSIIDRAEERRAPKKRVSRRSTARKDGRPGQSTRQGVDESRNPEELADFVDVYATLIEVLSMPKSH